MAAAMETENKAIQRLEKMAKDNNDALQAVTKTLGAVVEVMKKTPDPQWGSVRDNFSFGSLRKGENPLTSRGFSFMKMLGLITGACNKDEAKIELDVHSRLANNLKDHNSLWAGAGLVGINKFMAPLSTSFLSDGVADHNFRQEMKSLVNAGVNRADYDEMRHIRNKQLQHQGYNTKTLSWLNELLGGALVAPPEMGELIELLRNKEALVNAGARVVPLPPQGRIKYPRQTAASNTFWVGENAPIPSSDIGVGEVTLQAKKLAVLIKAPNELLRFASPAAEALMRDDMTKSLALGLDLAGLEGQGGDNRPRGILFMQNITRLTSSLQGVNGDSFVGKDVYRMIAAVEEANAEFESFIMRPKSLYKYYQLRADAVAQGDSAGPWLFNLIREAGDGVQAMLAGKPVITSTQISQVQSKGASSALTYVIGGMWSDLLIGMFGAIEFAATTMGDTAFTNDQTWVRGILSADIQARHEAAFSVIQNLDPTI